jgi:hypothetical protein
MLSEEHRPKVFDNRLLRRILGPKRNEMIGDWRKLHIKELHNLYSLHIQLESSSQEG